MTPGRHKPVYQGLIFEILDSSELSFSSLQKGKGTNYLLESSLPSGAPHCWRPPAVSSFTGERGLRSPRRVSAPVCPVVMPDEVIFCARFGLSV